MSTIFDKMIREEVSCEKVYEDEDVLAFNDISPQAPIHVLVIPKKKTEIFSEYAEADPLQVGVLFQKAAIVAKKLGLPRNGYRLVVNEGEHGKQTVKYTHIHIIGGRPLEWPPG